MYLIIASIALIFSLFSGLGAVPVQAKNIRGTNFDTKTKVTTCTYEAVKKGNDIEITVKSDDKADIKVIFLVPESALKIKSGKKTEGENRISREKSQIRLEHNHKKDGKILSNEIERLSIVLKSPTADFKFDETPLEVFVFDNLKRPGFGESTNKEMECKF